MSQKTKKTNELRVYPKHYRTLNMDMLSGIVVLDAHLVKYKCVID